MWAIMKKLLKIGKTQIIFTLLLCVLVPPCFAMQEAAFVITVDKEKVALGNTVKLNLTFYGTQNVSTPRTPQIEGFRVNYLGPSSRMSIVNGQVSASITHVYRLLPIKVGKFEIGPFSIGIKGMDYTSNSVTVEVFGKGYAPLPQARPPQTPTAVTEGLEDRVFLAMKTGKQTAYVNEIIPLNIELFVSNLEMRDIQYPVFQHDSFSAGEFEKPEQYPKIFHGIQYEVLEFKTDLFGTRPGDFELGPAELKGNLIIQKRRRSRRSIFDDFSDDDFFGNFLGKYETYPLSLKSTKIPITILPLPREGKPQGFKGAVGNFNLEVMTEPRIVKMGDPITLRIQIKGTGNFNTVNIPQLESQEAFKVYDPQVVKQEGGVKVFEQVLIPKKIGKQKIPKVTFSFFDTKRKIYKTLTEGPFPIEVLKPDREEQLKIVEMAEGAIVPITREILGRDIIYIKDSLGKLGIKGRYLYRSRWFLLFQIVPLFLFGVVFFVQKRSHRMKSDVRYARRIRASKEARKSVRKVKQFLDVGDPRNFYDQVFKTMQEYLGDKFHLPTGGITMNVVDEKLKSKNIREDILKKLKDIFIECDMARYAPSELGKDKMENTFNNVREVIECLEKVKV